MSRGKYSPVCPIHPRGYEYKYNCYGQIAEEYSTPYNDKTMFADYDENGYDSYGYSAFDRDGNFVGHGNGIDSDGWTEMDYLTLQDIPEEHRESYHYYNS